MLSVLITARNERYLEKTIQSVLSAAQGEIEVLVALDGYIPDPQIQMNDDRVAFYHYEKSIGQRPAINDLARKAKGKYILKTDAHSMFDDGFDVKLAADCEYDWTVIPRMYNLDVEKWAPKTNKVTDYMWIRSPTAKKKPFRHYYWDGPCRREHPEEYKAHKKWKKGRPDIDDVMTGQGACWFMHRDRFWDLGGLDEAHGQWGQMGIEMACKAWLSGGRHVVNKKTWFSHWFRGGSGPGFPWPASNKKQVKARKYSMDLWTNNKWPKQTRKLQWLVDKFMPLPEWGKKEKMPNPYTQQYARLQCKNPVGEVEPATIRPASSRATYPWFVMSREFNVRSTHKNLVRFAVDKKRDGIQWLNEVLDPFIKRIIKGEKFTDKQLKKLPYYDYLVSRLNPAVNPPSGPTRKGVHHCIKKMRDLINLVHDMKANGMKAPLDMYVHSQTKKKDGTVRYRVVIVRGTRRIRIARYLGWKRVVSRIWRTKHLAEKFIPTTDWPDKEGPITNLAAKQFMKNGSKATDKYYKHGYTYIYDKKFTELKRIGNLKILELGINQGSSIKLWADVFPQAQVYGIDIRDVAWEENKGDRITLFKGSYTDKKFLRKIAEEHGPFNLIVDDCDHVPPHQKTALEVLWPYVKSDINRGGMYVIEDFYHSYDKRYAANNMIDTVKGFIDKMYLTNEVKDVSFHPGVVIVTKA